MMMTQLKTIADIQTGPFGSQLHKEDYVETGTPIVTVEHLGNRVFTEQNLPRVADSDKARLIKYTLSTGDIVFSRVGSVDRCSYVDKSHDGWMFSGRCLRVRLTEPVDSLYLYYYFCLEETKQFVRNIAVGATMPSINTKLLGEVEIALPDLNSQKRIAAVLSSLDDKIENNQKLNDNLYHLLSLSFKNDYWDKAIDHPEWIMTTLDETTSRFGTGLNPRKNFVLGHGNNYYVTIKNMGNNRIYLDERCDKIDDEAIRRIQMRSDLKVGDLLFSGIGTIGRVFLIDKPATNWNTSESVFNLRPNAKVSSEFLYLLLLNNDMQDYAINLASGSVQKGIRMADLKKYSFFLPTLDVIKRLTSLWKPLIKQIKANEVESDSLAVLRDTLLPKLMSGEIDVSAVQP